MQSETNSSDWSAWRLRVQGAWDWLTQPDAAIKEVGDRNQARLLAGLSAILLLTDILGLVVTSIISPTSMGGTNFISLSTLAVILAVIYAVARTTSFRWGVMLGVAALSALAHITLLFSYQSDDSISGVVYAYIVLAYAFASVFLSVKEISVVVVINTILLALAPTLNPDLPGQEIMAALGTSLTVGALLAVSVGLRAEIERGRLAEVGAVNRQLDDVRRSLEQRVDERTRALQTSAEISRRLTTILDPKELARAVVDETQQAFGYYHTQMYQWDAAKENLALTAATGDAGRTMLEFEHKVARGRGLVGRAAETGKPVLAQDTNTEIGWLPNPLLPETRAEAAVPVMVGDEVVGVLDVQHDQPGMLGQADVDLLSSLANQLGVALENANQYARTQSALQELSMFRQFTDNAGQGLSLTALNGDAYYANPALLKMVGVSSIGDASETRSRDYYPPEYRQKLEEILPQVFSTGQWVGEMALQAQDGSIRPTLENIFLIKDDQDRPLYIADVITDMTSTKQAQQALEQQAEELAKVAHISAEISTVMEPEMLLQQAVDHIQESFGFYYVQVYMLNETRDALELSAGAGEVGRRLADKGWKLYLTGQRSLAAQAVAKRQGVIANDVKQNLNFMANELLPKTAAEMVVPLMAGDTLLGVLDVQSEHVDRFTPIDVAIQTTLAAQVAVAFQNAQQYQRTRQSEELVRTIIDATPDWIFIKNLEHRYELVNQSYANSVGLTKDGMLGKNDLDLGFDETIVKGDPARGIVGFWPDDDEVLRTGEMKIIPSEPSELGGELHYLSTIKIPIKDDSGKSTGVLGFVRDITERERMQRETAERLAEIDSLYRTMSRQGWQAFQQHTKMQTAFYYDRQEVKPDDGRWLLETEQAMQQNSLMQAPGQTVVAAPLSLRGDVIGALAVQTDEQHPLSAEELILLEEMSSQIALAMESARLFTQTQAALADTETLYGIIAEMNAAGGYQDILQTLAERTMLGQASPLLLMAVFDQPLSGDQYPEWIFPVAYRASGGLSVAERYPLNAFEAKPGTLFVDHPVILANLASDTRLDRVNRTLFQDVFKASSSVIFPLLLGKQMIGFLQAYYDQPTEVPEEEETRLSAVAGQAAIAVQSRLLLEQAQSRARREQRIRQVTAEVFNAANVDSIMRLAVEQVGQALGLPAYIYLGEKPNGEKSE